MIAPQSPSPKPPSYPDHADLMVVLDGEGGHHPVASPADWDVRRAHVLANAQEVMGRMPGGERRVPLDPEYGGPVAESNYVRIHVSLASEPGDRVPAWLLIPQGDPPPGGFPAMICLHQTVRVGKDEVVGIEARPNRSSAKELAERGYVVLAPDYPNFGEYAVDPYALGYDSATMKGVWNHMRGVDLLAGRPEVDAGRVGAIGHSLGGHNSIFLAVFDDRIRAVVSSCGFNSFPSYYGGNLAGWSHAGYMPRIRSKYGTDPGRMPFDFPELIGALAPRPFFTNSPLRDANFEVEGVRACIRSARPVYELLGAPEHLVAEYPDDEHDFPPDVRERSYRFLDRHLGRATTT
ncbi:alpha/beta hydrolase family protein [Tautonia plasticadhaerens]|uniref:Alpha/beta hydrolase family protein n=1 Tax=Tautonia plasticadhaerens TaxID=2527974 RepID=A0A518GVC2_9BACT|nr:alpha/beta fold hydrolase [Tautonia plasticadhaerens]QDV32533.1 Alpha/beta hydrolase family protein [Tautonia plasticadhaerens]